jgi:dTDP-4-amino-4,6-dideoxygalactose transaminase
MRNFGHKGQEEFWGLGINGKNSELHAAMGLCVLPHIDVIIERRKHLSDLYKKYLGEAGNNLQYPSIPLNTTYNYAYYPIVFADEKELLSVKDSLNASYIYPRRYFYPALHQLPYIPEKHSLSIAEQISSRVLCLPLYHDLPDEEVKKICNIIKQVLKY